ncbi:MAG: hypothetical protein AB4062_17645 [Crocosphaera sp.]
MTETTIMLRLFFYIFAGISTALIGWSLSQGIVYIVGLPFLESIRFLKQWSGVISIPVITICLATGMVLTEILLSNPTRPRISLKKSLIPLLEAMGGGVIFGVFVGVVLKLLYESQVAFEEKILRAFTWLVIGATVGFIESLAWQFHSMEAGDRKLRQKRRFISLAGASFFSVIAAGLFEVIRGFSDNVPEWFQQIEAPLGFCILGGLLAVVFTFSNSPSYLAALRAGKGFEYRQEKPNNEAENTPLDETYIANNIAELPRISQEIHDSLQFVTEESQEEIEEGLSLKLPAEGEVIIGGIKKTIKQGANGEKRIVGSDIYLPYTSPHLANIVVTKRETILKPNPKAFKKIKINGHPLLNAHNITLEHNTLISFDTNQDNSNNSYQPEMYRFVYYNRYLSPES